MQVVFKEHLQLDDSALLGAILKIAYHFNNAQEKSKSFLKDRGSSRICFATFLKTCNEAIGSDGAGLENIEAERKRK